MGNSTLTSTRKRRGWGRIWLLAIGIVLVLLIGLSLWLTVAGDPKNQFTITPETTVLTGPLTEDGLVDYAEAIRRRNREAVPPDQNAARLLLEAIGPDAFINDERAQQAYEQLEMEPLPADGQYLTRLMDIADELLDESVADFDRTWFLRTDQLRHCCRFRWSADDAPEIADWIALNDSPLEKVTAASELSCCRPPLIGRPGDALFVFSHSPIDVREMCELLTARAMLNLNSGNAAGAWEDIHATHRLSRMISQAYTSEDHRIAVAASAIAVNAMPSLLSSPDLTPELLQSMHADWARLPAWREVSATVDEGDRYIMLDLIQQAAHDTHVLHSISAHSNNGFGWFAEHPVMDRVVNAMVDWDAIFVDANALFDEAVEVLNVTDIELRRSMATEFEARARRRWSSAYNSPVRGVPTNPIVSAILTHWCLPDLEDLVAADDRRNARDAIVETALAIEQFRFDHGRIPSSLAELAPEYLPAVPMDPCAPDDELIYITHPGEAYVLYSVGHDGVDNGGTSERDDVIFQVRMPVPDMPRFESSTPEPKPATGSETSPTAP
jgi:hypothetical protein